MTRAPRKNEKKAPAPEWAPASEGAEARSKDLLRRLTLAPGPPGAEDSVRRLVREHLGGAGSLSHDRLGSLLCELKGAAAAPRVLLDAHLDEVGFQVQSIGEDGRIRFLPLGGWWEHVLLAQRVDILTRLDDSSGAAAAEPRLVPGVIGSKPPHFLKPEERQKVLSIDLLTIDVGATTQAGAEALGIRVGDPIVPHAEFLEMGVEGVLSSKAFDNRVGVALLCETLRDLAQGSHPNTVIGVWATQEEVGCRGAGTAAALARPDVALVLEGTPADDIQGVPERQALLGHGPQVRFSDPTALSNRRLVRLVEEVARERRVPVQLAVRRSGGTDAKSIHVHGIGVPTVVIGVPARYIHTHVGLIQFADYLAARTLVLGVVERLDRKTVDGLTDFGA